MDSAALTRHLSSCPHGWLPSISSNSDEAGCILFTRFHLQEGLLHHHTVEEVDGPGGVGGIALGVRHHDDRGSLGIELGEQFHYFASVLRVEVSRGFIGEDKLGLHHYGTCDGHALLLTAGELLRIMAGAVADGHATHDFRDAFLALSCGHAEVLQWQFDVLFHGELIDEVEALEYEADLPATRLGALTFPQAADLHAVEPVLPFRGIVQETEDVQQRRFAATRRTHNSNELAVLHFQCDAPEGCGLHHICAEDLLDVFEFNHLFIYYLKIYHLLFIALLFTTFSFTNYHLQ